jgi:hypothetical protein
MFLRPGLATLRVDEVHLVEYIKHPGLSFEQIAARLQEQRQLTLAPESIRRFFQEHDLKKTPEAPS